jgi:ABC-type glycerol-3-phosphate transport system substrate-binding protein
LFYETDTHQSSCRTGNYLTALWRFALGLLVIFGMVGCGPEKTNTPAHTITPSRIHTQTGTGTIQPATVTGTPRLTPTPTNSTTLALPTPTSAILVQASELSGIRLDLWHPWQGEAAEMIQELVNEFNRDNEWNIRVNTVAYQGYGSLEDSIRQALLLNELPDMWFGFNYQAARWDIGKNSLVDLNFYVEDPVWGLSSTEESDFFPVFWVEDVVRISVGGRAQSKRLGVPFYRTAFVLFYNQSLAEELGFPTPPDSIQGFRNQVCAAASATRSDQDPSNDGAGWLITPEPATLLAWISAFGGEIIRPDGEGYQFDSPEAQRALVFLKELQNENCLRFYTGMDPAGEFAQRRGLVLLDSISSITTQEAAFLTEANRDRWIAIPIPAFSTSGVIESFGPSLSISTSSPEEQLAAWLFAKWIISTENQSRWSLEIMVFPVRASALESLEMESMRNQRWAETLNFIPLSRAEPGYPSWTVVRWMLGDALEQLLSPQFTSDQVPELLETLDKLAGEAFNQIR